MPFRLRYMAHDLELPIGEFVVGRSTECQLSLDDPLVSRRHAVLRVRRDGVSVQDFGSRNGVLVNGTKITGERELAVGDKVSIGSQEMLLQAAADVSPLATSVGEEVYRRATQTLGAAYVVDLRSAVAELAAAGAAAQAKAGVTPPPPAPAASAPAAPPPAKEQPSSPAPPKPPSHSPDPEGGSAPKPMPAPGEASRSVQSFALLGGVADKALAMGKADEAERILNALLQDVVARAREGSALDATVTEPACRYAARLAGATLKASWVDYCFELYRRQRRVLPAPIIDELYTVVRKVKNLEPAGIRAYLDALREVSASFGPTDRFLVQRIEGLERQIALK